MRKGGIVVGALLAVVVVGYTASVAHAGDAPCSARDFTVDNLSWNRSATFPPDYIAVRGRITNHCPQPSGVQITVTVNDADGKPLTGDSLWPNSTQDIAPGTSYWFVAPIRLPDGRIGSLDASVIGTRRWHDE